MAEERIEHHECPREIAEKLTLAGGLNPFGEPMFRCVWGYDRIVRITGFWDDVQRVETRLEPKYLPGNCWHLEMWRPPEEYGSPETWGKAGEEVVGMMTVDTAGPFPSRGEYELCYPITSNLGPDGVPVKDIDGVVEYIVKLIRQGQKEKLTYLQRLSAIAQREARERQKRIERTVDDLLDVRPAFYDQPTSFRSGPKKHSVVERNSERRIWLPPSFGN